jgi:hypothetical protein
VVISLNLKPMTVNPKLTKGNLEGMHPMLAHISKSNNKVVSQLPKVFKIESHLTKKTLGGAIQVT